MGPHRKGTLHSVPNALSRIYEEKIIEQADAFSEDVVKRDPWYMRILVSYEKLQRNTINGKSKREDCISTIIAPSLIWF